MAISAASTTITWPKILNAPLAMLATRRTDSNDYFRVKMTREDKIIRYSHSGAMTLQRGCHCRDVTGRTMHEAAVIALLRPANAMCEATVIPPVCLAKSCVRQLSSPHVTGENHV